MSNPTLQGIEYLKTHPELLTEFNERFDSSVSEEALNLLIGGGGTSDQLLDSYFGERILQEDQQQAVADEEARRMEAEAKTTAPEIQEEIVDPLGEMIMGPLSRLYADETDESALIEPAAPFTSPTQWQTPFGRPLYQDRRTKTKRAADVGVDVGWGETDQGQRLQSVIAGVPGDSINYSVPYVLDREFQLPPWGHEYNLSKEEHTKGWQFNHPITNQLTLFEDPTQIDTLTSTLCKRLDDARRLTDKDARGLHLAIHTLELLRGGGHIHPNQSEPIAGLMQAAKVLGEPGLLIKTVL